MEGTHSCLSLLFLAALLQLEQALDTGVLDSWVALRTSS